MLRSRRREEQVYTLICLVINICLDTKDIMTNDIFIYYENRLIKGLRSLAFGSFGANFRMEDNDIFGYINLKKAFKPNMFYTVTIIIDSTLN